MCHHTQTHLLILSLSRGDSNMQTATLSTHAGLRSGYFACMESFHLLQSILWGNRPVTDGHMTALFVAHPGTRLSRTAPGVGHAVSMPSLPGLDEQVKPRHSWTK